MGLKYSILLTFGLVIIFYSYKFYINSKGVKENDDKSDLDELDKLSISKNKTKVNRNIIDKILEEDYASILKKLKRKKLHVLFAIKANIENDINSNELFEKEIGNMFGVLIAFIIGGITTIYAGSYSGTVANLISDIVKIEKNNIQNSCSIKEITKYSEDLNSKISTDGLFLPMIIIGSVFFVFLIIVRFNDYREYKFDNRVNVLLDLVNFAIEFRKEKEMVKSKEQEDTELKEQEDTELKEQEDTESNELVENGTKIEVKKNLKELGNKCFNSYKANQLIKKLNDKIEDGTVKKEIFYYQLPQLYNIKANLKNSLDVGNYFYTIILQVPTILLAVLLAIQEKEWKYMGVVVSFIIVLVFLLWIGYDKVYAKDNTNKILFLEIVKEEIESKKKASVKNSARKTRRLK